MTLFRYAIRYSQEKYKQHRFSNLDSAKFYAFNSLVAAGNNNEKALSYFYMGYIAKKQMLLHEAVTYYQKALKIADSQNFVLTTQSNLANVLHQVGKTEEALKLITPVLKARKKAKHKKLHYVYNVLANIYSAAGQLDSARLYYRKSLEADRGKISKSGTRWDLAELYLKRYGKRPCFGTTPTSTKPSEKKICNA